MNRKICKIFSIFSFLSFKNSAKNVQSSLNVRNFFQKWGFCILLLIILFFLSSCVSGLSGKGNTASGTSLEICITESTLGVLPLYYAYEKGYLEEYSIQFCAASSSSSQSLLVATPWEALSSYEKNPKNPNMMIAGLSLGSTACIAIDTPISSPSDLSGKTISCQNQPWERALLFHALLRTGTTGVTLSWDTSEKPTSHNACSLLNTPGPQSIPYFFCQFTPKVFSSVLLASKDYATSHKEVCSQLALGIEKGLADLSGDTPEHIAKTVASYYTNIDTKNLTEYIRQLQLAGVWGNTTQITEAQFRIMLHLLEEAGCLEKESARLFTYKELCYIPASISSNEAS